MALHRRPARAGARAHPARRRAPVRRGRRPALVASAGRARACARASPTTASGSPTSSPHYVDDHRRRRRSSTSPCRSSTARRSGPASTTLSSSPTQADETRARCSSTAPAPSTAASPAGAHGLPLMGTGDWNDGMNRVGEAGRGESVWLGWFLHAALDGASRRSREARGETARARRAGAAHAAALAQALERDGWDGDWYRRGYFDDGTPLGSAGSDECRIDSIAQSWAVLSGAGRPGTRGAGDGGGRPAPRAAATTGIALLFTPPFDKTRARSRLHQGLPARHPRERRPVHPRRRLVGHRASPRSATATRRRELFSLLNPINHARDARRRAALQGRALRRRGRRLFGARRMSDAAAGPGTPARPAGCTAPASRRSSVFA